MDQFKEEMLKSLATGDGAIIDDLVCLDQYELPTIEKYFQGSVEFDRWAKDKGFDDVFGRSQGQS